MENTAIRQKLHCLIDEADDKFLRFIYAVAKEYTGEYEFTSDEISYLEERHAKRLIGESKIYNWQEIRNFIARKKDRH